MGIIEEGIRIATWVKDLCPGMNYFNIHVIVVAPRNNTWTTADGKQVRSFKVADKTGQVDISVWGEYCNMINSGDILLMQNCYSRLYRNRLTINR